MSALRFEGSGAALAARGVRLPAGGGGGGGGGRARREREGQRGEAPLGVGPGGAEVAVVGRGWVA